MNKKENSSGDGGEPDATRMQPVEWFEDAPFRVEIKSRPACPPPARSERSQDHVNLQSRIFSCRPAHGHARFGPGDWLYVMGHAAQKTERSDASPDHR